MLKEKIELENEKLLLLKSLESLWHVVDEIEHTAEMCGEDHIIHRLRDIAFKYDKSFNTLFEALDEELPDEMDGTSHRKEDL